jgi:predicted ABC-type ATPase
LRIALSETGPNLVAIAGPNGAGKSTFYQANLSSFGLPFINADVLALEFGLGAYQAAELAEGQRRQMFVGRESFIFETVFSDPVGEKLAFLEEASASGYTVVLCFVGISAPEVSVERVAMRVAKGGHDVPTEKLTARYARVLENLRLAMLRLPLVLIYDNDDLREPHRFCVAAGMGKVLEVVGTVPEWLQGLSPAR